MKRIKIYIEIIIAVVFVAVVAMSCQRSEIIAANETETRMLYFSPVLGVAQTATRAAESDNSVLQIASAEGVKPPHIVIEAYTGTPGSSLQKYFSDELGYFKSGDYWDVNSDIKRFLPTGGMTLYGYFATDFAERGELTNVEYIHPVTATDYPQLTFTPQTSDALHQVDLIAAKVENITNPSVMIPFRHVLSQINFGVKGVDRHQITISNLRVSNVYGSGTFDYNSWSWSANSTANESYPYYFPDRTDINPNSGLGIDYKTSGADDDSKNSYIFGDGGKFGPGSDNTSLYAQVGGGYATKANTPEPLHNSLMLIPQDITKNANATVTFDYQIAIDGRVIRSGTNQIVSLNTYYDWKPNLRYIYLFDFNDPSEKIVFDVLIDEWQNWDSDGQNTGIKNGSIQQPTAKTLNTIGDNEVIYLLGLLERNLVWDWSNGALYTFDNINTLTLDFSGVETMTSSVEVKVPTDFTITGTNPTTGGKLTLTRNTKKLLEPTTRELNLLKNSDSFTLYGTLTDNLAWSLEGVKFSSLRQNESFVLNFSGVIFHSDKTITLQLPSGVIATGSGVSGNNPYAISSAANVTITDKRVSAVILPSRSILDVISDNTVIGINGGTVGSSGDSWDWGSYTFDNLDPQEYFYLDFSGINFNGKDIEVSLPAGFRGFSGSGPKLNPYSVTDNGKVTIKNNRINYPTPEYINALSGENTVALAGEKLPGDNTQLDWSRYTFPNFSPQTYFTFDVTGVDFVQNLVLTLPPYFVLSPGAGVTGSNPYTFTAPTTVSIKNDRVPRPSNPKINSVKDGDVVIINGGVLLDNEIWAWSGLPFTSLGGRGNSFSLTFQNINFNGNYIEINIPGFIIKGSGVSNPSFGVYRISSNTTITIEDDRRSVTGGNPSLTDITAGQRVVLAGVASGAQGWRWDQMPNLAAGQWFEIDYSQLGLNGADYLYLPLDGASYLLTGDYQSGWAYLFYKHSGYTNGIVRFTKQYAFPVIDDSTPANSYYTLSAGAMFGPYEWWIWKWTDATGFVIDFSNITFSGSITVIVQNYKGIATNGAENVVGNGTSTLSISGPCIIKVTP